MIINYGLGLRIRWGSFVNFENLDRNDGIELGVNLFRVLTIETEIYKYV